MNIHVHRKPNPLIVHEKLVELYVTNMSLEQIAGEIGVSHHSLKNYLRRNRESFPRRERGLRGTLTQEQIQRAAKMWTEGVEIKAIADYFGVTKNVILGKANSYRHLFPRRREPNKTKEEREAIKRKPKSRVKSNWNRTVFSTPAPTIDHDPEYYARKTEYDAERLSDAKPLYELSSKECKWPLNDGGPYLFCAADASGEYCDHHDARARSYRKLKAVEVLANLAAA